MVKPKKPRPLPEEVKRLPTKSHKIRALHKPPHNWSTGDIARSVGVIYQFAYNVLKRPLKRELKRQQLERIAKEQKHEQKHEQKQRKPEPEPEREPSLFELARLRKLTNSNGEPDT